MNVQDSLQPVNSQKEVVKTGNLKKKPMGPPCYNCRIKCTSRISTKDRQKIHAEFWGMKEKSKKWDYIDKLVETKKTSTGNGTRKLHHKYFLTTDNGRTKVCSTMFFHTLSVYTLTPLCKILYFSKIHFVIFY